MQGEERQLLQLGFLNEVNEVILKQMIRGSMCSRLEQILNFLNGSSISISRYLFLHLMSSNNFFSYSSMNTLILSIVISNEYNRQKTIETLISLITDESRRPQAHYYDTIRLLLEYKLGEEHNVDVTIKG